MNNNHIASYRTISNENKESKDTEKSANPIRCLLCPHSCLVGKNQTGRCGARTNIDGELIASSYGQVTSIALDPIEKKPLYHFYPGSKIVSVGSFGCNLHCPFCQNHTISMEYKNIKTEYIAPTELADIAAQLIPQGNIGVAYTYNEPLIGFEYVFDSARHIKDRGLKNVLVTNGYINEAPLRELLPYIDAMNIDIKGGAGKTYKEVGGTLEVVKQNVKLAHSICHIEITTLIVPGLNENDVEDIAMWIASVDRKIPYHISRFFPRYKYIDRAPTEKSTITRLRDIAAQHLDFVYMGNV